MEQKINVAELLKDCPTDMELDSPMYDNLYFDRVEEDHGLLILCYTIYHGNKTVVYFTEFGSYNEHKTSKCVIFPKGKTTWEGFVPPCKFKEGDVVVCNYGNIHLLHTEDSSYCAFRKRWNNKLDPTTTTSVKVVRLATEEEKQILFDAIKENGYKWNAETKTLEITRLNFKVGDWIIRNNKYTGIPVKVIEFNGYYSCELNGEVVNFTRNDVHNNFHLWTIDDAKDGDVLVDKDNNIGIFQKFEGIYWYSYIYLGCDGNLRGFNIGGSHKQTDVHPATKEQRDLLFQKIKEKGYEWNDKTKILERLISPQFKVGNRIKEKQTGICGEIISVQKNRYDVKIDDKGLYVYFREQDNWELVSKKFDINTLKPLQPVLVRDSNIGRWDITFYELYDSINKIYPYRTLGGCIYKQCIPYKGNEDLIGLVKDCDDYYKTWINEENEFN